MSVRKINEWAMPFVKLFRTYIDIGASVGNTSEPYLSQFKSVIAFEPNPESFKQLEKIQNITAYNYALGKSEEIAKLIIPETTLDPEHGSIAIRRNAGWTGPTYNIQVKTLDSFSFNDVDFIKVDVEQGELEVIQGAIETIKKYKPTVMFENKRNENDELIDLFLQLGYNYKKYKSDTVVYIG